MRHHGHAVDNTGILILADSIGACPSHLQESVRAVMPHSRQNNAHRVAFCHIGNGTEQDVNGGPCLLYTSKMPILYRMIRQVP